MMTISPIWSHAGVRRCCNTWPSIVVCLIVLCNGALYADDIDVFDLISEADALNSAGRLDQALQLYTRIATIEPDNIYALNRASLLSIKLNDEMTARATITSLLKVDPDNTFGRYWLGILELKDEKIDEAFSQFSKIIDINPRDSNAAYAHMFLGAIYTFRHQPARAILELKKAREKADKPDVHYKLARAYHDAGMFSNARLAYIRTLKMEPGNLQAMDGLGWVLFNEGERQRAIDLWLYGWTLSGWKHRELRENLAKAYNDMAMEHYRAGRQDQARECWEKVVYFDSQNKAAQHFLKKIR